ncbi:type III-A CRISPR-associated protein Csm2 [Desulfofundulus sp.]|uniref:type III-A CRISPR-associated protein Csm2 n=1 Tax=Desulfofundulus sp. TaxID=2282750 RepID=UPI003C70B21F
MLDGDYLKGGYFDAKGYLRKELLTSDAEKVARVLSQKGMTSAALRRFYNKLKAIDAKLQSEEFDAVKPDLYSLQANVIYNAGRLSDGNNKLVPEEFLEFMRTNIEKAEIDRKHFKAFIEHFQSVLAYFTYFKEKNNQRR